MTTSLEESQLDERIQETKGLAYYVSLRFKNRGAGLGIDYDDIVSESMIGLIKAIRGFDPTYGVKFSTYAINVIKNQVSEFFRNSNNGLKYSRRSKELLSKLEGNETVEEIMEKYQVKRSLVEEAFAYRSKPMALSIDKAFDYGEEDSIIGSFVGYKEDFSVVYVNEFLSALTPKMRTVLELTLKDKTQREIAKVIGCSQVNVYRMLKRIKELYLVFSNERGNN